MRAILVSVDFDDVLSLTLPYNCHHFDEVWVVTAPGKPDVAVAEQYGARVLETNAFWEQGAAFNKWRALEQGLDAMGRNGWLCLMDADILWPRELKWPSYRSGEMLVSGYLYTPRRRMLETIPKEVPPEAVWVKYPMHPQQREFAGYSQIFHAEDRCLRKPPWHDVNYTSAGTADSFFQAKWPESRKIRPPFEVLHLGEAGRNWMGRVTPRVDGSVPEEAAERRQRLTQMLALRRGKSGMARFEHERLK